MIFLDSSHVYNHFGTELALYWQFLKSGGVLLVHDILGEGNEIWRGKAQAADRIDRYIPVYLVSMNQPMVRFFYSGEYA